MSAKRRDAQRLRTDAFHRDPFPVYRALRDQQPVFHDVERDAFVVTRFADVIEAARDHHVFSSIDPQPDVLDRMTRMDPPRHDQWRAITAPKFRPRSAATIEERVRALAASLFDTFAAQGGGDVVADLAGPLPSAVIGDLIGVPRELNPRFHELSMRSIAGTGTAEGVVANEAIYAMFEPLIHDRMRAPQDDLMSMLANARVTYDRIGAPCAPRPLDLEELLGYCTHLVVAGNDTTTNLIGTGVWLLAEFPAARRALIAEPSLIPAAIEEMIRRDGPVQMLPRRMACDHTLHGVVIPQGALVELYWGAANRDERRFTNPDDFDLERRDQTHLGFGHGVHFCLGSHVARLEARVMFEELLRRVPHYRLITTDLEIKPGWAIRGFASVPIEL